MNNTETSRSPDVRIDNQGTIIVMHPLSENATTWMEQNTPDATRWGQAIVVEHRYADDVIEGMIGAGLAVGQ